MLSGVLTSVDCAEAGRENGCWGGGGADGGRLVNDCFDAAD